MMESSSNKTPALSVVILGYGEEDRLPAYVAAVESEVKSLGLSYELILVANYWPGTGDRTPVVATKLAQENGSIKVLAEPKAGTMGWDMRSGLKEAQGDLLAVIDGDGQVQPHDLVRVYHELHGRSLDLCQTYRTKRWDGWERNAVSKIYNWIFRLLFPGTPVRDVNSKPKLMTRAMYNSLHLTSSDWFIDAEIIIQARRFRFKVGQIPSIFGKKQGRSYVNLSTILEFLRNLFTFRIRETRYSLKKPPSPS